MATPSTLSLDDALELLKSDISTLLHRLKPLSTKQAKKLTPLMAVALAISNPYNARRAVEALLSVRPEWVNAPTGPDKQTPLMVAIRNGDLDLADVLFKFSADPKKRDKNSNDALHCAIHYSANYRIQEVVTAVVLENGNFTKHQKSWALAKAADESNFGAVRALLKHGAGFSAELRASFSQDDTSTVGTALQAACFVEEDTYHAKDIVDALLAHDQIKAVLDQGWDNEDFGAALHCAAFNDSDVMLAKLLAKGACVNPPDHMEGEHPKTPLMSAACTTSIRCLTLLLEAGADATRVDEDGKNALHHLAGGDSSLTEEEELPYLLPCFRALMDAGTDPRAVDKEGNTPADVARTAGRDVLARLLAEIVLEETLVTTTPQTNKPRQF